MTEEMYHKHKPFKCPDCGEVNTSLWVEEEYDTVTGCEGIFEVETECCLYKLDGDEIDAIDIYENAGRRYGR